MDKKMQQFQDDLMEAVRDMKAGRAARAHRVSVRTLQGWEQGRKQPSGAARTLIDIARRNPEVLRQAA